MRRREKEPTHSSFFIIPCIIITGAPSLPSITEDTLSARSNAAPSMPVIVALKGFVMGV